MTLKGAVVTNVLALALAAGLASPARAGTIGGLDLVSNSSIFETGTAQALPLLGWTVVSGSAQIFDAGNGGLIGGSPWDNYLVEYITGVAILPSSTYTLTIDMGFIAELTGGQADYLLSLGTVAGGVFTSLGSTSGSVTYLGNMNLGIYSATGVTVVVNTGGLVSGDALAVRWEQTGTLGSPYSDYFGFDNVLLDVTSTPPTPAPVPEPATLLLVGLGSLGVAATRVRRHHGRR